MTDDKHNHVDQELSRVYREGAWPEPGRQIDEAILGASRRAARARRSASLAWRWGPRFALAATVVLTFTLVLRVYQEQPEVVSPPVSAKPPTPSARGPAAPAAPQAKTESAAAPEKKALAAKTESERASEKQAREFEKRLERSMQLRYQITPAQPDSAAGAAKGFASEASRADRVQQLQRSPRAPESAPPRQPEIEGQPMRSAPLRVQEAPAPIFTQTTPASGANVVSGLVSGRAAAPERSPLTWIEDIRKLKSQGKTEEAGRELAEFRKRYPEYPLPDDLR